MKPPGEAKGIKLTIDSHLEHIGLVGLAVQGLCSYVGFSEVEAYQIQLCVVEAVTNVVKHAYGAQAGHEVRVEVTLNPDRISFRIMDEGKTMKPLSREPLEFAPTNLAAIPEGGLGLHIIQTVMDEVDYQTADGTNILTMHKNLRKMSPA
jgi:serine/threonine-protein kinase RsbW